MSIESGRRLLIWSSVTALGPRSTRELSLFITNDVIATLYTRYPASLVPG
jgi:hypothetical protein